MPNTHIEELESKLLYYFTGMDYSIAPLFALSKADINLIKKIVKEQIVREQNSLSILDEYITSYQIELDTIALGIERIEHAIYSHTSTAKHLPGPSGFFGSSSYNFSTTNDVSTYLSTNDAQDFSSRVTTRFLMGAGLAIAANLFKSVIDLAPSFTPMQLSKTILISTMVLITVDELIARPLGVNSRANYVKGVMNELLSASSIDGFSAIKHRQQFIKVMLEALTQVRRECVQQNMSQHMHAAQRRI